MTSLNNPVKLPLDSNGNVLANLNAQNITPNAKATNITLDANGNVLANVNAQNINPNVNTVNNPTIANPYTPLLLSHQTGLSGTPSTNNVPINVGSSITSPRAGLARIRVFGHVNAGSGSIDFTLTSAGITTYFGTSTATILNNSLFNTSYGTGVGTTAGGINNTSKAFLYPIVQNNSSYGNFIFELVIPLEANDVLQFRVSNNTANDTTYIDDLEVLLI